MWFLEGRPGLDPQVAEGVNPTVSPLTPINHNLYKTFVMRGRPGHSLQSFHGIFCLPVSSEPRSQMTTVMFVEAVHTKALHITHRDSSVS